jgi:SPP1 family predicted phage head-tail adaptor
MAADPQIGELTDRIKIRRWQDQPDAGFGIEPTFDGGIDVWAKVLPVGSAIFFGAMQVGEGITHQVLVRYSPSVNEATVTEQHIFELDDQRYRIKRANKFKGQKNFLFIEAELLGDIASP